MLIDLSVALNPQTAVYPGDQPIEVKPGGELKRDGFNDHYISIGTHVGTHIDAPSHMLADGQNLDQMPPEQFIGRGRLVSLVDQKFDLKTLQAADIQAGDIVLFHSGLSEAYYQPGYFQDYPAMPEDIAQYLIKQRIKMVGVDMCSVDHDVFVAHKLLLAGNVLIIENLTNLDQLASHDFTVYALPIKLQLDGAPARVIAEIHE